MQGMDRWLSDLGNLRPPLPGQLLTPPLSWWGYSFCSKSGNVSPLHVWIQLGTVTRASDKLFIWGKPSWTFLTLLKEIIAIVRNIWMSSPLLKAAAYWAICYEVTLISKPYHIDGRVHHRLSGQFGSVYTRLTSPWIDPSMFSLPYLITWPNRHSWLSILLLVRSVILVI